MLKPQNMAGTDEVAEMLGWSGSYVRRLCRQDRIPHMRWGGRWLFDKEKIRRWVDAGMPDPSEQPGLFDDQSGSED